MKKKNFLINTAFLACTVIIALFFISCSSSLPPVNVDSNGIAIKGYDAVAYHSMRKAVIGTPAFEYEWNGAKWRFSKEEHKRLFMDFPDRYAPKYGGYCAYAVSQGTTADIDPNAWLIMDLDLYLNLDQNTKKLWKDGGNKIIETADSNWPGVLKQ
jgi:hypothetical protein